MPLPPGNSYQLTVNTTVEDYSGIALVSPFVLDFSTVGVQPIVVSVTPSTGSTGVDLSTQIVVTFNEPMMNVTATTFTVAQTDNFFDGGTTGPIPGEVDVFPTGYSATFSPLVDYQPTTTYQVVLSDQITDSSGATLETYMSTFTTGVAPPPRDAGMPADGG
jgi:archaellin